jgi:hypothetical protein
MPSAANEFISGVQLLFTLSAKARANVVGREAD